MTEKKLLILGAGQYGHLVKELAEISGDYAQISFLDDHHPDAIGKLRDASRYADSYCDAVAAIGNSEVRRICMDMLESIGFHIPVLCHPMGYISPSATVAAGCIIEPMAVVSTNARLGKGSFVSAGAVVNHDSVIESFCHIDCNAVIPAGTCVTSGTKVPSGTVYGTE